MEITDEMVKAFQRSLQADGGDWSYDVERIIADTQDEAPATGEGTRQLRDGEPAPPAGPQVPACPTCGGCREWGGNGLWHHAGCNGNAARLEAPATGDEREMLGELKCLEFLSEGYPGETTFTRSRVLKIMAEFGGDIMQASAAHRREDQRDAERWRTFERALQSGHLRGAAYGRRFKIIETCPMSGDEKEFNAFVEAIDAAMQLTAAPAHGENGADHD